MLRKWCAGVLAVLVCGVCFMAFASAAEKKEEKKPTYIGVKMCVMCHKSRDNSIEVWRKMKHSKAYEALGTDAAKKFSKDPQNDPKCLACHVTGLDQPGGFSLKMAKEMKEMNDNLKGVTCEVCHGPGSYYKAVMMKAMPKGSTFDADAAKKAGLVTPTKEVCLKCHNKNSPSFKEFKPEEALKIIKHGEKLAEKK